MKRFLAAALVLFVTSTSVAGCGRESSEDIGAQLMSEAAPHIYKLTPPSNPDSGGTGSVIRTPSGKRVMLTNAHVCGLAENGKLAARREDGAVFILKVRKIYKRHDLCALDPVKGDYGLQLARSYSEAPGTRVWAAGYPLLRPFTVTWGVISGRHDITIQEDTPPEQCSGRGRHAETMQTIFGAFDICVRTLSAVDTTVTIFGGSSGSPAFNERGEVIGVMFAGDTRSNWGLYVPYPFVDTFLRGL